MATEDPLTERQLQILTFVRDAVRARGFPPSVREIGDAVGLKSTSSVHYQLATLQERGYLRRDPTLPRAIEVIVPEGQERPISTLPPGLREVPLVGDIAAGAPVIADEQALARYPLPRDLVGEGSLFMLTVRGDSMLEAGVFEGDLVVVRQQASVEQGEMCAALIDGEATVKFFRRTPAGEVFLDPANPAYEPIPVPKGSESTVLGRVTAVLRSL